MNTNNDRVALGATLMHHGPLARPGFDLWELKLPEGDETVRNLRRIRYECGRVVYRGQNNEIFYIEDGLL